MHSNSQLLFQKYAKPFFRSHMRVLEIGPDHPPSTYRRIVGDETIEWETLDIFPSENLTHIAENEYTFPLADNTFDVIISGQVIEHVKKIWVWIKELSRVCKVGGYVITINPVSWPYHEAPIDCWRIYPEGMKALYDEAGLACQLSKFETLEVDISQSLVLNDDGLTISTRDDSLKKLLDKLIRRPVLAPGASYGSGSGYKNLVKRFFGLPIQCSVDTITIGLKQT